MRNMSFLAALRNRDGRSLVRAVAILFLFNLFAAGFHAGAMASDGDGTFVLCAGSAANDGGQPAGPRGDHSDDCCLTGCMSAPIAAAAHGSAFLDLPDRSTGRVTLRTPVAPIANVVQRSHARGPPILA